MHLSKRAYALENIVIKEDLWEESVVILMFYVSHISCYEVIHCCYQKLDILLKNFDDEKKCTKNIKSW